MLVCLQAVLRLAKGSFLVLHKLPLQHQSFIRPSAVAVHNLTPQVVRHLSTYQDLRGLTVPLYHSLQVIS